MYLRDQTKACLGQRLVELNSVSLSTKSNTALALNGILLRNIGSHHVCGPTDVIHMTEPKHQDLEAFCTKFPHDLEHIVDHGPVYNNTFHCVAGLVGHPEKVT